MKKISLQELEKTYARHKELEARTAALAPVNEKLRQAMVVMRFYGSLVDDILADVEDILADVESDVKKHRKLASARKVKKPRKTAKR